jgi:hypothetical protein
MEHILAEVRGIEKVQESVVEGVFVQYSIMRLTRRRAILTRSPSVSGSYRSANLCTYGADRCSYGPNLCQVKQSTRKRKA